ncbi:dihydroneopterin aldolase [Asticcacaulis sp. EMRT-3]|uniref:dihydroneopterin aldolase n=1 Tax=Asticcacaulis sp. EMRT-3 TaxID=3040349 RepID=UPI0024AF4F50|nr:dihydroneopterin aldolase [Asticcacaulis sp. EMRT-3]MDI7776284.1 dihydroneopterin aldolase [Asticcacaulis sp. EMRT-3]
MITTRRVFVRGLKVMAAIGIYDHEHGRQQPLVIDAVFDLSLHAIGGLKDTLNYEKVGEIARDFIARGHIKLVETLAEDMAGALLALPHVQRVEISIAKPEALSDADQAGVCVVYVRE